MKLQKTEVIVSEKKGDKIYTTKETFIDDEEQSSNKVAIPMLCIAAIAICIIVVCCII